MKHFRVIILTIISFLSACSTVYAGVDYNISPIKSLHDIDISPSYTSEMDMLLSADPAVTAAKYMMSQEKPIASKANEKTFRVTAYTAGHESTGKHPGDKGYGITASGKTVKEKQTLACPPSMPFGTEIYIPALEETYTCEDRGSAITEGKLDIYISNLDKALQFGVQHLDVRIMHADADEAKKS